MAFQNLILIEADILISNCELDETKFTVFFLLLVSRKPSILPCPKQLVWATDRYLKVELN